MVLKFFSTLTRKKEAFKPLKKGVASLYTCGPTVYDFPHIGNYRAYVFEDVLRRYLEFKGFKIRQVMNLTDVDDKTIRGSRKAGVSLKEFTRKYEKIFSEDLKALNIEKAEFYPRATEHVPQMVALVKKLLKEGLAYKSKDGSTYFSIRKFKDYGELAHLKLGDLKAGARVCADNYDKEHASDFALWKAWTPADGKVFWETALGKGRPGWHLECSVMAMHYLGETIDIHAGGVDLVFPHHQNEIAQSEGATGKKFARYWIHNEHLLVEGKKMSKSLGNFYTLRDVLGKGFAPLGVRFLLLSSHYRQQLNFTFDALKGAENAIEKINLFAQSMREFKDGSENKVFRKLLEKTREDFERFMDDDLNTPQALSVLFEFIHRTNKLVEEKKFGEKNARNSLELLKKFDKVLGVLEPPRKVDAELKKIVEARLKEREKARKKKDFARADKIRKELLEMGVVVEDTPKGVKWRKK